MDVFDDLAQPCGSLVQASGEALKILELLSYVMVQADTVLVCVADACLQNAEQTPAARDGKDHATELAKDLAPGLQGDSLATT